MNKCGAMLAVFALATIPAWAADAPNASAVQEKLDGAIPNFTGTWQHPAFPWFEPPASGPKPVTNLMRWPQLPITEGMAATKEGVSNYDELVGDYKNPILQPWAADIVKKFGEISRAGVTYPNPSNQCQPMPPPFTFKNFVLVVLQEKDMITFLYANPQHDIRRIRLNAAHPKPLTPSWYGDSVGHYEGDTLVVDTVGLNDRTFIDDEGSSHSTQLHVVERYRKIDGGAKLELTMTVEDPVTLEHSYSYKRIYHWRPDVRPQEYICEENNRNAPVNGVTVAK